MFRIICERQCRSNILMFTILRMFKKSIRYEYSLNKDVKVHNGIDRLYDDLCQVHNGTSLRPTININIEYATINRMYGKFMLYKIDNRDNVMINKSIDYKLPQCISCIEGLPKDHMTNVLQKEYNVTNEIYEHFSKYIECYMLFCPCDGEHLYCIQQDHTQINTFMVKISEIDLIRMINLVPSFKGAQCIKIDDKRSIKIYECFYERCVRSDRSTLAKF